MSAKPSRKVDARAAGARRKKRALVWRIAVDERLADDLVRLLVCPLAEEVEEFFDRKGDWGKERERWVRPRSYVKKLGLPPSQVEEWPWEALTEGQVFLSGQFEIVGDRQAPKYFKVSPGREEFLRIDNLEEFKRGTKRLYSYLLTRTMDVRRG